MIDANYILQRKKEVETFIGVNLDKIPSAVVDQLNDYHAEMVHLIFALEKEKESLQRYNDYLWRSRKQIAEMFEEENTENAERNKRDH